MLLCHVDDVRFGGQEGGLCVLDSLGQVYKMVFVQLLKLLYVLTHIGHRIGTGILIFECLLLTFKSSILSSKGIN